MADLQKERQRHANHRGDQVSHGLVGLVGYIPRIAVSIDLDLSGSRVGAVFLHRMHSNVPIKQISVSTLL